MTTTTITTTTKSANAQSFLAAVLRTRCPRSYRPVPCPLGSPALQAADVVPAVAAARNAAFAFVGVAAAVAAAAAAAAVASSALRLQATF